MQLSLNWLRHYVDLPESIEDLEALLTNVGLEVESIEDRRSSFANIVVGEVLTCEKHPNADKLSVCTVSDGVETATVVCGAPNVAAGQKVVFARVGANMEKLGFTIDRRKLRGVESAGMICSSAELGLDDDHSGITVLATDAVPGTPIAQHLGYDDVILGIGITPNRGDALSHVGTARDIAAERGVPLRLPTPPEGPPTSSEDIPIEIADPALCPRYTGAIIRNVRVQESPDWLRQALTAVGIRPINSIVDVTNYVMMEIGQPMHAFDLARLHDRRIMVRASREGERIVTLDKQERALPVGSMLICDGDGPVAVAGVMGGEHSSVTDGTTEILLESACFQASSVRRTAKLLQLSTDSSYRFERGSDPNITLWAIRRAAQLIIETSGGEWSGVTDVYPIPVDPKQVTLRPAFVNRILGIDIPVGEQHRILTALEIAVDDDATDAWQCSIPTFRSDIEREIDLVEEIARIHGYDNIPVPTRIEMNVGGRFDDQEFPGRLRTLLLGLGFDEILSSSLVPRAFAGVGVDEAAVVDVRNPVSKERPSLRSSLLPSLLEAIDVNIRNGLSSLRIAELGRVFQRQEENQFVERNMLAFAVSGAAVDRSWYAAERPSDFFDLKGATEQLLSALYIDNDTAFHYDRTSTLSDHVLMLEVKGRYAGQLVEVSDMILETFDIGQPVYYAELDIDVLREALPERHVYQPIPRHPNVTRDLAVIVPRSVLAEQIIKTVHTAHPRHLRAIRIVDVFTHESLGPDRKSIAFSMSFQAEDRTLKDKDVTASVDAVVAALARELQAELRS